MFLMWCPYFLFIFVQHQINSCVEKQSKFVLKTVLRYSIFWYVKRFALHQLLVVVFFSHTTRVDYSQKSCSKIQENHYDANYIREFYTKKQRMSNVDFRNKFKILTKLFKRMVNCSNTHQSVLNM